MPAKVLVSYWLLVLFLGSRLFAADITCPNDLIDYLGEAYPLSQQTIREAVALAERWQLPYRVLKVGYPDYPRYRLFIGLDVTRADALGAYMETFHWTAQRGAVGGHLVIENFATNSGDRATTPSMRTLTDPTGHLWAAKAFQGSWATHWANVTTNGTGYLLDHIIPLDPARRDTVDAQFRQASARDRCKTNAEGNCTEWISNLIVGQTIIGEAAQKYHLASYLGFSRTIEHDELSRRLTHAANGNHTVVFVLYRGAASQASFVANPNAFLPPIPKIDATRVLKLLGTPPQIRSEVMTAIRQIPTGSRIFLPLAAGTSQTAFEALLRRAGEITAPEPFKLDLLLNGLSSNALGEALNRADGRFAIRAFFVGKNLAPFSRDQKIEVAPITLGKLGQLIKQGKEGFTYGAVIVQVSPADAQGRHSLGPNCDHIMDLIRANPRVAVIAAINSNVPRTTGENFIKTGQITASFTDNSPLPNPATPPVTEVETNIARHLATLIPSEATLQVGIGSVFGALPAALRSANVARLKIWTEVFSDAMMQMMQAGTATEAVTSFAYGSAAMYTWLGGNPSVVFKDSSEVNSPTTIAAKPRFHAINTAFQVSLNGEVNAMIDAAGYVISSPGGQPEFMEGGSLSKDGKAIIAMRSTANVGGTIISRITGFLYYGPITTPSHHVTHVVTEHGVAALEGKSRKEKAIALIRIAHPDFRATLLQEAVRNGQIPPNDAAGMQL